MNRLLTTAASLLLAASIPTAHAQQPDELFPRVAGWRLAIDSTLYTPANLWDMIDGAAESFISYGFQTLYLGEYLSGDSIDVRVELYRHSSLSNAFGVYATERKPDYHFVQIGTQGYADEGILNFLAGNFYVKLSTHRSGKKAKEALEMIARSVDNHLNQPKSWPQGLGYLPREGRQPNTEGYAAQNFLGYSFLSSAFTGQFGEGPGFQIFVIEAGASNEARLIVRKYLEIATGTEVSPGLFHITDQNSGEIVLVLKGKLLFGLVNPPGKVVENRYISLLTSTER